jgi:hypothetical protein
MQYSDFSVNLLSVVDSFTYVGEAPTIPGVTISALSRFGHIISCSVI